MSWNRDNGAGWRGRGIDRGPDQRSSRRGCNNDGRADQGGGRCTSLNGAWGRGTACHWNDDSGSLAGGAVLNGGSTAGDDLADSAEGGGLNNRGGGCGDLLLNLTIRELIGQSSHNGRASAQGSESN